MVLFWFRFALPLSEILGFDFFLWRRLSRVFSKLGSSLLISEFRGSRFLIKFDLSISLYVFPSNPKVISNFNLRFQWPFLGVFVKNSMVYF